MLAWFLFSALAAKPTHPVCGGIPGGMFDDVAVVGTTLSVTMHRLISDDASAIHLGTLFFDADGKRLDRWRGDHSKPFYVKKSSTWVHRAEVPIPEGSARVELYDLHHERVCFVTLQPAVVIERVERTGKHKNKALPEARPDTEFADETLEGEAIDVKRGRKAKLVEREVEEPPDNLEQRAVLLAKLKQNLPRMSKQQVLDWMGHQGFEPDDPDVIEALGPDWLQSLR